MIGRGLRTAPGPQYQAWGHSKPSSGPRNQARAPKDHAWAPESRDQARGLPRPSSRCPLKPSLGPLRRSTEFLQTPCSQAPSDQARRPPEARIDRGPQETMLGRGGAQTRHQGPPETKPGDPTRPRLGDTRTTLPPSQIPRTGAPKTKPGPPEADTKPGGPLRVRSIFVLSSTKI